MVETIRFVRRNLPHWLVADRPYFVTIRLKGTLPESVVSELSAERETLARQAHLDENAWSELHQRHFAKIESVLDACDNEHRWLENSEIGCMIFKNLSWLEMSRGWRVYAATVMPNHIHLLMRNFEGRNGELLRDVKHFKSFTGQKANEVLGRSGRFWAKEDFDHWCRTPEKTMAVAHYICKNPVEAGLAARWRDWPWTCCVEDYWPT